MANMANIEDKLKILPALPGCYLMKNKDQEIIYVGKNENGEYEEYYSVTDTGAYYLQSIEIKKYGLSNLKIKYERSLNNV